MSLPACQLEVEVHRGHHRTTCVCAHNKLPCRWEGLAWLSLEGQEGNEGRQIRLQSYPCFSGSKPLELLWKTTAEDTRRRLGTQPARGVPDGEQPDHQGLLWYVLNCQSD